MSETLDFEQILRMALHPVDPPEDLKMRMQSKLQELTDLAVDELDAWELSSIRDPRNWPATASTIAAVAVGATAGTALVILRVRAQQKKRRAAASNPADLADLTLRAAFGEARKLLRHD